MKNRKALPSSIRTGLLISLWLTLGACPGFTQEKTAISIISSRGIVEVQKAGAAEWIAASEGMILSPQDKIRTLVNSRAQLKYPDQSEITMRENSFLTISDNSQNEKTGSLKRQLKLDVGAIKYKVTHLEDKGSEFKIHSSTAIVGVTGTEGDLSAGGNGQPTVNVLLDGSTYNTDENGENGTGLKPGNAWEISEEAESDKHTLSEEEKQSNDFKEKDPAVQKRVDEFLALYSQKMNQGYDMTPLVKIKADILKTFGEFDYPRTNALLDEAAALVEALTQPTDPRAQEIAQELQSLAEEIQAKQAQGYLVSAAYAIFYQAQQSYQQANFDEAQDLIRQLKEMLPALEKGTDDFNQRLSALMNELNAKAKEGFIVDEISELVKRIQLADANGTRQEAEALLKEAVAMLSIAKRGMPQALLKELEELQTAILKNKAEGFDVEILEELLDQAQKAKEQNEYLTLEELTGKMRALLNQGLLKIIPEDIRVLYADFNEQVEKKTAAGYDLSGLKETIKSVSDARQNGEFPKLRALLEEGLGKLKALAIPESLLLRLKEFNTALLEKKNAGYETTEIENLALQAQAAVDKGLIKDARAILDKAEELLQTLKDTTGPTLQANYSFSEDGLSITVAGVVTDNIRVAWVSQNGSLIPFESNGEFTQTLPLNANLKEITLSAQDSSGNLSPEIIIPIPLDKLAGITAGNDTTIPALNADDMRLDYVLPDSLKISGKTEPSAQVSINGLIVTAAGDGSFISEIKATKDLVDTGLEISAKDAAGNSRSPIHLDVPDKWPPVISQCAISFQDEIPPVLNVFDLEYPDGKVKISGNAKDAANILISGIAQDYGAGIKEFFFNEVKSSEFKCSLLLAEELKYVEIKIEDLAANIYTERKVVDAPYLSVSVLVNDEEVVVDQKGNFATYITADENLRQVIVKARDLAGNEATAVKLAVADTVAPSLKLGEPLYTKDTAEITGTTQPHAKVYCKEGSLFADSLLADDNGIFKTSIKRPAQTVSALIVAEDGSGNISPEASLTITALQDNKPPVLTVYNLQYSGNNVLVLGAAEDDTGIQSLTVNNTPVELSNNQFSAQLELTPELITIEVKATDLSGKTASNIAVIKDDIKPEISLKDLSYEAGYCVVKGTASDNIGLKEVRVNGTPIAIKLPEGGDFEYRLPISAEVKEVTASVLDLYGNFAESVPLAINLPPDNEPPVLSLNEITYGSPLAIVSGLVKDNVGAKSLYVNNLPLDIYEDGSFKVNLPITFSAPVVTLNAVAYESGLATISGKVSLGEQTPAEANVYAEDLAGNKCQPKTLTLAPYSVNDIKVSANGQPVDLKDGVFSIKLDLEKGMADVQITAIDPVGTPSEAKTAALEKDPPTVTLNEAVYANNSVTISGTAQDSGSGISEVLINGAPVAVGAEGKFSQTFTIFQNSITAEAVDKLGNPSEVQTITLAPPDKAAPVFLVKVHPLPASIGKNVFIGIDVIDGKTRLPEILPLPPEVSVTLPAAAGSRKLPVSGSGSTFSAELETTGLSAGLINIALKGADLAKNSGEKIEGISSFLLTSGDNIPPSLMLSISPAAGVYAGSMINIQIASSETLKTLPKIKVELPGKPAQELTPEGTPGATIFFKTIALPLDLAAGEALISASGAVDLSDNTQTTPAQFRFIIQPAAASASSGLTLKLESPQITAEMISIKGLTSAAAIVRITLGHILADVPADINGRFSFTRAITAEDLDKLARISSGPYAQMNCYASNYAGAQSPAITQMLPLPPPKTMGEDEIYFEVIPQIVEPGRPVTIKIKSPRNFNLKSLLVRFSNNRSEQLLAPGTYTEIAPVYQTTAATPFGQAMVELRTDTLLKTRSFTVGLPAANMLYTVAAYPDPAILGKESLITVRSQTALTNAPRLSIRLPDGKISNIALSGSGMEFKGTFACPETITPGPAELIINEGEYRRPYGINAATTYSSEDYSDVYISVNPLPLVTGSAATISLTSIRPLSFVPKIALRLSNGRIIYQLISGAIPGTIFSGPLNIPADAVYGTATIHAINNNNALMKEFPVYIAPGSFASTAIESLINPAQFMPGQNVFITVNSKDAPFSAIPQAKLIFANGLIQPVYLSGALPSSYLSSSVFIPATAAAGPVTLAISDSTGKTIASAQGTVSAPANTNICGWLSFAGLTTVPAQPIIGQAVNIMLDIPVSLPPVNERPQIRINYITGSSSIVTLSQGIIPGWHFEGTLASLQNDVTSVTIETLNCGQRTIPITPTNSGSNCSWLAYATVSTTPAQPIIGQPLNFILDIPINQAAVLERPQLRVNFVDGANHLVNLPQGVVPGRHFEGTLAALPNTFNSIVIETAACGQRTIPFTPITNVNCDWISYATLSTTPAQPISGQPVNFILDIPTNQASVTERPQIRINFVNGTSQPVTLPQGTVPGRHFESSLAALANTFSSLTIVSSTCPERTISYTTNTGTVNCDVLNYATLTLNPAQPVVGQALTFILDVPTSQAYLPVRPQLRVNSQIVSLPQGMEPGWHFEGTLASLQSTFSSVTIEMGSCQRIVTFSFTTSGLVIKDSTPNPPLRGAYCEFPIEFSTAPGYTPTVIAQFANGPKHLEVVGAGLLYTARLQSYDWLLPTNNIDITVKDPQGNIISPTSPSNPRAFPIPLLGCPTGVWSEPTGTCSERLIHWATVPAASGYDIYAGNTNPPTTKWKEVFSGSILAEKITGLNCGQLYWYSVVARGEPTTCQVYSFNTTSSGSSLIITEPADGHIDWGNVTAGSLSSTKTITVQNLNSASSLRLRRKSGTGLLQGPGGYTFTEGSLSFDDSSFLVPASSTLTRNIAVTVPTAAAGYPGIYAKILELYQDTNSNGIQDSGEVTIKTSGGADISLSLSVPSIEINSTSAATTVYGLSAVNHGGNGTIIDLTWSDSASGNHYHVYKNSASPTFTYGSPQTTTTNKAVQMTDLTPGTTYYFLVRNSPATHSAGDSESNNTDYVWKTPTASNDATPPIFAGIKRAYATNTAGQVKIEYDAAADVNTPITYSIYASTSPSTLFSSSPHGTTTLTSPYTANGLTNNTLYYFGVRAKDNMYYQENNTRYETAIPYSGINHITITSPTQSSVGTPVLVKLTAYSSPDDNEANISSGFSDAVQVQVLEQAGYSGRKYLLSVQDRVTGDLAEIPMSGGKGYFTVDAVQPDVVKLSIVGIPYLPGGGQTITFTGNSTTQAISQFALSYDTTAQVGPDGSLVRIYAIDNTGKTISNYADTITYSIGDPGGASTVFSKVNAGGNLNTGANQYTFIVADGGEAIFKLNDSVAEDVTFSVTAPANSNPNTATIRFRGVTGYNITSNEGSSMINPSTIGHRIKFTAKAVDSGSTVVGNYNGAANWVRTGETVPNNSARVTPSPIVFTNGVAEFYVENTEYETVTFHIEEQGNPSLNSGTPTLATFTSSDITLPDITRVEAETPFLIHIYFSEDIDSTNAVIPGNYGNVGTINKICWYGDEVTLHLANALTPLGSSKSVAVNGDSPDGIKDTNGNFMGDATEPFTVPTVDYQGSSYGTGDWLEIQTSSASVPAGSAQTIRVMVSQKNACGYLSGSNAINKGANVNAVSFSYSGQTSVLVSPPSSQSMSDGKSEISLTVNFTAGGQTVTVTATAGGVTSGTAQISSF